jgi:hypothetical protein
MILDPAVAAITGRVNEQATGIFSFIRLLHVSVSGQLPDLG